MWWSPLPWVRHYYFLGGEVECLNVVFQSYIASSRPVVKRCTVRKIPSAVIMSRSWNIGWRNRSTDHIITLLTLFTVNTNLITTFVISVLSLDSRQLMYIFFKSCLSISELVTVSCSCRFKWYIKTSIIIIMQFLTLPKATVYGGIGFLTAKSKDSKIISVTDTLTQMPKHTLIPSSLCPYTSISQA